MSTDRHTELAHQLLDAVGGDVAAAIKAVQESSRDRIERARNRTVVPDTAPVAVELKGVTKRYKLGSERIEALKSVDLTIREGEFVAITGSSGSGKSTMLQLIGALDKPTKGQVVIGGTDISKLRDRKLSIFRNQTIGFVFQFFYLQPFLTTEVNLEVPGMFARMPRKQRKERAKELATAVGLEERLRHLPKELSGGQMQRAAIARALLNQPKILLADEPTGNLDQANSTAIIDQFEAVRKNYGTTVIIVTHDRAIASRADREIVLSDGEVVRS